MTIHAGCKMSKMQTRRAKKHASSGPTPVLGTNSFNNTNTDNHDGREHYEKCQDIYDMFQNERYSSDDEDIDEYKNIKQSDIQTIAYRPTLFPYNDFVRWCFTHLQKDTTMIVNTSAILIASLKFEDIRICYKTLEPTISLDEAFLDKLTFDYKDFEALMENWFMDEEWLVNKGERYIPSHYLKDPYP
jgi:phosphoenolpyruvate synthase/pyruvate phosphate dikinase